MIRRRVCTAVNKGESFDSSVTLVLSLLPMDAIICISKFIQNYHLLHLLIAFPVIGL